MPFSPKAMERLLLDGTERIANCRGIALAEIHGPALSGVQLERFDVDSELTGDAPFKKTFSLADRRQFVRCVRWLEEARVDGRRSIVVGSEPLRIGLILAVASRWAGDVDRGMALLGLEPTAIQREAAHWACGLP